MKHNSFRKVRKVLFYVIVALGFPVIVNLALTEQDPRQYAQEVTPVYIIPSAEKVSQGQELIIALQVKPKPTAVKSVVLNLTYPQEKLSSPTISYSNSPFTITNEQLVYPGIIKIDKETTIPVVDEKQIASIKFVANSEVTPQEIKLAPGSFAISGIDNKKLPISLTIVDSEYYHASAYNGFLGPFLKFFDDINPF